jgi:4-amino-4-deoxy-L-arabinose transferase-like glycosyltransferase
MALASLIRRAMRDGWKLAVIWLAITGYNLFKPYHIDDTAHLEIARSIAAHPLHPMTGMLNWGGIDEPIYRTNNPHLYFYLLAVWGSLFGFCEATMHALQALLALAAILLFYGIARQLVPANAIWLTGMLALGPSFAVEQNLMLDVPLLSLWLLFFNALILGADADISGQRHRFLVAALACSAALLVKYSSLVLLLILVVVIVHECRWRFSWAALVPLAVVAAWSLFNYFDYGGIHILRRPGGGEHGFYEHVFYTPLSRFVACMMTLGAITPFGLVLIMRLVPLLRRWGPIIYSTTALLFALLVMAVATDRLGELLADKALRAAFLVNAAVMMFAVAMVSRRQLAARRTSLSPNPADARLLILLLWIAGHLSFYSLFAPAMAIRHLLLVLPAVLLVGALLWPARLPRADATFGLATSVALSVALGWADWSFATFLRNEAMLIRATLPAEARVWFTGHWGWQWYAARAGLRQVDVARAEFAPGDFLVVPRDLDDEPIRNPPRLVLFRSDSKRLGIGDLFCTTKLDPWQLTRSCTNIIDIYRVY